jgi:hypothetical protein
VTYIPSFDVEPAEDEYVDRWVVRHDGEIVLAQTRRLTDGTVSVRVRRGRTVYVGVATRAFDSEEDAWAYVRENP